ncbi:hypothetical protein ACLKA6_005308 [Drosophila palustris]
MKFLVVLFLVATMMAAVQCQTETITSLINDIEDIVADNDITSSYSYDYPTYLYYDDYYYTSDIATTQAPFKQQLFSLLFNKKG